MEFRLRPQVNDPTFNGDEDDDSGDVDKRQQHSVTPPHYQPTVEILPVGTDSLEIVTIELNRLSKDFRRSKPDSAGINNLIGNSNNKMNDLLRS